MPDDTINYKVNIDASSVAEQLAQIRNQVDMAMATYTFNATTPDPTPRAYAFPSQGLSAQIAAIGTEASQAALETGREVGAGIQVAQEQVASFADSARLGFQKFSHDVQNTMLMTPVRGPSLVSPYGETGAAPESFMQMGAPRLGFEAVTGWGFDPRMSMTPGRYQRYAREALSDRAVEMGLGTLDFAAGATTVGAIGANLLGMGTTAGVLGGAAAILAPASLAAGAFMGTAGYDVNATMRGRAFTRDASWRFLSGRFLNEEASSLGLSIATAGRSPETVGYGVSQNDAMSMVQEFTQIGGFDTARTAEEFRQRVKTLVDNTRKYVQVLGVTQQEAVGMMKEFMDLGLISNTGAGAGLGLNMAAQAYRAGYTPSEFHRFGMQSAEMVRGTGIMMGAGYIGGQGALAGIRTMQREGVLPGEVTLQLGGAEQAAATMTRVGYNFGMSEAGLTYFAARDFLGGGQGALNPQEAIAAATGRIRDVNDYLSFKGAQPRMTGQVGAEALYRGQANWYLEQFRMAQQATPGLKFNEDTFAGFLGEITGGQMSDPERRLMFSTIASAAQGGAARRMGETISEATRLRDEARPGIVTSVTDVVQNRLAEMLGTRQVARQATEFGNWVDNITTDIQRAGQRGDILGGIFAGVGTAMFGVSGGLLGAIPRAYGVNVAELNKVTFDPEIVKQGLRQLQAQAAPVTQQQVMARGAREALDVDPERVFAVSASLSKLGIKPFVDGTPEERITKANEEYNLLEARAKSGNDEAKAIIDSTTRGEFMATMAGTTGTAGIPVREYLTKIRSKDKDNVIGDLGSIKNEWEKLRTKIRDERVPASDYQWGMTQQDLEIKRIYEFAPAAAKDQAREAAIIDEYNRGVLQTETYKRAIAGGKTKVEAADIASASVAYASRLNDLSKEVQAKEVVARLGSSDASQNILRMTLEQAGLAPNEFNLATPEGRIRAIQALPGKEQEQMIRMSGYITNVSSDKRDVIEKQQEQLLTNLKTVDNDIITTLSKMSNVDLNMVTPEQMQEATNKLMVAELRSISSAMGSGGKGRALRVVVDKED